MSSGQEQTTDQFLEKYNNGEDLTTIECWRLWNWLKDEKAIVPRAKVQPRPNLRSLVSAAGSKSTMSADQFDIFIAQ